MRSDRESTGRFQIGELSRRVGVNVELLRAWERRYGVLSPARTAGGFRLYSDADERLVLQMLSHLGAGVSAGEAARLTRLELDEKASGSRGDPPAAGAVGGRLLEAIDQFDEAGAQSALDELLSAFTLETVMTAVVLPCLREFGERWSRGDGSIAQEHFASSLLRGRLLGLARGWGTGAGPLALLACIPGDQHDLGLISFGLALRGHGWRITFLGPDTPLVTLTETARLLRPSLVVVTAALPVQVSACESGLSEFARSAPLALAGGGVEGATARAVGALHLQGDPFSAAKRVAGGADRDGTDKASAVP